MSEQPAEPKKLPLRIRLPFATEDEFIERYGHHITKGGIFLATRSAKPEATQVSFELVLADGSRVMRGEGVVQKVVVDEQPGKSGMLVRFTRVDARTKALIDRIGALRAGFVASEAPHLRATPSNDNQPPVSASPVPQPPPAAVAPAPKTGPVALADDVVLGIDLGTTTCRAAVFVDGMPKLVHLPDERSVAMPSVVAWDATRRKLVVGSAAKKHRVERPESGVSGFKRLMGFRARSRSVRTMKQRYTFTIDADNLGDVGANLGGRIYSMPELAAELLKEIKNAAQNMIARELSRCILCVPAWYNDHQRAAVLEAAHLAGLSVLQILNEPSAVALAFGYGRGLARKRVLVYDLGGGTFDASVVEITGDDLEVVSTGGDNFLGGMDFDERLADALIATLPEGARDRLTASRMTLERVRDAAEVAKIALSDRDTVPVHVPFATTDEDGSPLDVRTETQRVFLEQLTQDLVDRTAEITGMVLQSAGLTPAHLDEVLLVGGQSRAPAVRKRLETVLGRAARTDVDPQGAVALGAALLGQSLVLRERGKRGVTLLDVLSAPIGVAVRGGGMRRLLERNTRLPAEKTLVVPVEANQVVNIAVYQGMSVRADENEYLGSFQTMSDRHGDLSVRFSVTTDGRLSLAGSAPSGKKIDLALTTADASDELQAKLFADAPLPGEAANDRSTGLFTGLKKLFGR